MPSPHLLGSDIWWCEARLLDNWPCRQIAKTRHVEFPALRPLGIESCNHRDFSGEANQRDVVMTRAGAALNAGIDVLTAVNEIFPAGFDGEKPVLGIELI